MPDDTDTSARPSNESGASRRNFMLGSLATCGCIAIGCIATGRRAAAEPSPKSKVNAMVRIENFSADGKSAGIVQASKVVKSEAEWRKQLSKDSFQVTRREATERAFSGKYADNHAAGVYRCICCETALFDAQTKFDSGTGWPSFWKPISALNVAEIEDNSLFSRRTAVACQRCDAHLGHVFDDGPKPTGLRYCMNSVALNFVPKPA